MGFLRLNNTECERESKVVNYFSFCRENRLYYGQHNTFLKAFESFIEFSVPFKGSKSVITKKSLKEVSDFKETGLRKSFVLKEVPMSKS